MIQLPNSLHIKSFQNIRKVQMADAFATSKSSLIPNDRIFPDLQVRYSAISALAKCCKLGPSDSTVLEKLSRRFL